MKELQLPVPTQSLALWGFSHSVHQFQPLSLKNVLKGKKHPLMLFHKKILQSHSSCKSRPDGGGEALWADGILSVAKRNVAGGILWNGGMLFWSDRVLKWDGGVSKWVPMLHSAGCTRGRF